MNLHNPRIGHRALRPALQVEGLESRLLLASGAAATSTLVQVGNASPDETAAANLTLLSVDPAPGSTLSTAPAAVTLTFDRPIDPFSLGSNDDFDLLQVAPDGATTSIYYAVNPSPTEALDDTGTQLTLSLNRQLGPGTYQVVLLGSSSIAGLDGTMLTGEGANNLPITNFTITAPSLTLADATDLGALGEPPLSVPGALDLQSNPAAVSLYQFTLAPGSFWLLGLEVDAQADGSPLDSALALFDDQGNPIATDEIGRNDDPDDPYLFAGLPGGTYYVGVSGIQNLPGDPGGYDLATGTPGSVSQNQAGGPFTLQLVADPENTPPALINFQVNHADPIDPAPTGLTLGFSRALLVPNNVDVSSTLNGGIEVVGPSGPVPIVASSYSEADASVSYLFQDPLPAGKYTVMIPPQGGLTDLAGLSPVAAHQPPGVLGTFTVAPQAGASQDPFDFGPLLPGTAVNGVTASVGLPPGQSNIFRFVVTFPALYTFASSYSGGSLALGLTGPGGPYQLDAGLANTVNGTNDTLLAPGVYQLELTANGAQPVTAQVTIQAALISWESILENGVGQGPALALRLIAPTAPAPLPLPQLVPPSLPEVPGSTEPASVSSVVAATSAPSLTTGLFVTLGGTMVGRPTLASGSVPLNSTATDLADAVPSAVPQPIGYRLGASTPSSLRTSTPTPVLDLIADLAAQLPVKVVALKPVLTADLAGPTVRILDLGWLARAAESLGTWFTARDRATPVAALASVAAAPAAARPTTESETVSQSSMPLFVSTSIGLGLTTALVVPNRRRIHRWLSSRRRRQAALGSRERELWT